MKRKLAFVAILAFGATVPATATATATNACLDDACTVQSLVVAEPSGSAAATPTRYGAWGFDLTGMDKSVKPGND